MTTGDLVQDIWSQEFGTIEVLIDPYIIVALLDGSLTYVTSEDDLVLVSSCRFMYIFSGG